MKTKSLSILGIRGIPASHGGFETFAENLSIYLVGKGWGVNVYCQESRNEHTKPFETNWHGVRRIHIPVHSHGAKATVSFDYLSIKHASRHPSLILTLGYNTALFNIIFRIKGMKNLINMDGIEWKRDKWSWYEKAWLYANERAGCFIGHHLIADHPEISHHLSTRVPESKITMIPYGARGVTDADSSLLAPFKLEPRRYTLVVARPEPENSILEIVNAFSSRPRGQKLVILGNYDAANPYHVSVMNSASEEVHFVGAVYDHSTLDALRFYATLYIHGHTVGGTNPSLIEAMGAGQPVLAHGNPFNRWVAGAGSAFFKDERECSNALDALLPDQARLDKMSAFSRQRHAEAFTWNHILSKYEQLLLRWV